MKQKDKDNILAWLMSGLFGVLSGAFLVWGYQLEKIDMIDPSDSNANLVMLMLMVVLTVDARHVWNNYNDSRNGAKLFGLFKIKTNEELKSDKNSKQFTDEAFYPAKNEKQAFFMNWAVLILLELPVLLAEYPGFFVYDAQNELNEVLTRNFSTHHPLLHVLLLGGIIALFHKLTGSWNVGICAYTVIQMLVITAIFAYVLGFMSKKGVGKRSRILWMLYYGIFPTIVMFTLCSSKDGLFSALLLLMTMMLIELVTDTDGFVADKKKVAAFVFVAALCPCFRHNGFYAYLVFVPFALIYFRKRLGPLLVSALVLPVILYLMISTCLSTVFSKEITHHQEMLTVPIMQLTRVYTTEKDTMTAEEIKMLTSYIPEENLRLYNPRISDLVKYGFNNALYENNSGDFWRLWFSQLKKHPVSYVNAWFLTSYGYWYPAAKINVYKGTAVYTFTYDVNSYFGYEVEFPGVRHSLIPAIDSLYRYMSIGYFFEDMPVLGLLLAPGLMFFIYLFVMLYRLSVRNLAGILPFMPLMLTWMTVLLGPTYLARYVLYLWLCLPLLFVHIDS